jgi:hypothetical protein
VSAFVIINLISSHLPTARRLTFSRKSLLLFIAYRIRKSTMANASSLTAKVLLSLLMAAAFIGTTIRYNQVRDLLSCSVWCRTVLCSVLEAYHGIRMEKQPGNVFSSVKTIRYLPLLIPQCLSIVLSHIHMAPPFLNPCTETTRRFGIHPKDKKGSTRPRKRR